jgi:8-oxo-dGTP pyrophosphatase MutT (NUDIX family)
VATTAIVAEILIVGLGATAWFVVLFLTVFGTDWLDAAALSDFAALTTLAVLAGAYVLGILIDRAADSLFTYLRSTRLGWWLNRRFGQSSLELLLPADFGMMRLEALREGGALAAFMEYQRSRLRVVRGTAVNLAVGTPILFAFLWRNGETWEAFVAAGFLLAGLAASVPAGERIRTAYLERLIDAYSLLVSEEERKNRKPRDIVAAITYAVVDGDPRLLLVRTSRGRRWTFPKGKVEEGESAPEAALREAREEAGVIGAIEGGPFTTYRYPSKHGEREIAAYLLRADPTAELAPSEAVRTPEWMSAREARDRLRHRRTKRHAAEHERVLKEALDRIAAASRSR